MKIVKRSSTVRPGSFRYPGAISSDARFSAPGLTCILAALAISGLSFFLIGDVGAATLVLRNSTAASQWRKVRRRASANGIGTRLPRVRRLVQDVHDRFRRNDGLGDHEGVVVRYQDVHGVCPLREVGRSRDP